MTFSPIPKWQVNDSSGDPVVGGTLYFYDAGTSTPKNVFSDAARSVSLGAELTTDSLGQVGPVYLDTAAKTKVVAKDAADATLWTVDNMSAPGGVTTATDATNRATCPLDYGAVGDGAADESSDVQSAIDDATGDVDLAGKTYRCDSVLTLKSGIRVYNGTLDFSNCSSASNLVSGTGSLGTPVNLGSDAGAGDKQLTLSSTSGFAAGDWVWLKSSADWDGTTDHGELGLVKSVDSGTLLTLSAAIVGDYTTATTATLAKITPLTRVHLLNVDIVAADAASQTGVSLTYGIYCKLDNVTVSGAKSGGFSLTTCVHCSVDSPSVRSLQTGGTAIGVSVRKASYKCSVNNPKIDDCDIGIIVGSVSEGVCRQVGINGGSINGCLTYGVQFHHMTQDCSISGTKLRGISTGTGVGVFVEGSDITCEGLSVKYFGAEGIYVAPSRQLAYTYGSLNDNMTNRVRGCEVKFSGASGIRSYAFGSSLDIDGLDISDNDVIGAASHGILVEASTASLSVAHVRGNRIQSPGADGIRATCAASTTIDALHIVDNIITGVPTGGSDVGIYVDSTDPADVDRLSVNGNEVSGGSIGIRVNDSGHTNITKNRVTGHDGVGIHYEASDATAGTIDNLRVDNNDVYDSGSTSEGILVDSTQQSASPLCLSVCGNTVNHAAGKGVKVSMKYCNGASVSGNTVVVPATAIGLHVEGTGATGILRAAINNNTIQGRVVIDQLLNSVVSGNQINSNSTDPSLDVIDSDTVAVSGNAIENVETAAGSACVELSGVSATDIALTGNLLIGGEYAMSETTTATYVTATANITKGYGSAVFNGTWALGTDSATGTNFYNGKP